MSELIISVSGLRGIVGQSLTPDAAIRFVGAFLAGLEPPGPIVIGRDGRSTGPMLANLISGTAMASGFDVLYADVAATPTVGILVRETRSAGGIQISASHNPPPYNGIKLFGADGRVISADEGAAVIARYRRSAAVWKTHEATGQFSLLTDTTSHHLARVLATVDVERIRQRRFRVVLDANHGAGSVMGRLLLQALGCEFDIVGDVPDGHFAHPPEPTATNLAGVAQRSLSVGADVVFCQDPDADRLAIIDATGNYIGEEYTVAIVLDHVLATNRGPVVTNCSTSRMAADLAERHGCSFSLSAVGEANVTGEMIARKAVYGGEGNGGPIDPRVGYVRDSFVGMAQVLDAMAARKASVAELVAAIPRYEICKTTVPVAREHVPELLDRLQQKFPDATASQRDGLRLDWPDRWLLVRPSNTEPIVRAVAEATSLTAAQELCERTASIAQSLGG